MGLRFWGGSLSTYDVPQKLPNPDPENFKIVKDFGMGKALAVLIEYPDCKNYEGKKILVYDNIDIFELSRYQSIDPHFSESTKFKSPIARFVPNEKGWNLAKQLVRKLYNEPRLG